LVWNVDNTRMTQVAITMTGILIILTIFRDLIILIILTIFRDLVIIHDLVIHHLGHDDVSMDRMPPMFPTDDGRPLALHDNPRPLSRAPRIHLKVPSHKSTLI
jgi:hypothetical protein